jgi:hypothetical protein
MYNLVSVIIFHKEIYAYEGAAKAGSHKNKCAGSPAHVT